MSEQSVPKGFERATGTIEGRRKCMSKTCGQLYPVTDHDLETTCPECGHGHTTNADPKPNSIKPVRAG